MHKILPLRAAIRMEKCSDINTAQDDYCKRAGSERKIDREMICTHTLDQSAPTSYVHAKMEREVITNSERRMTLRDFLSRPYAKRWVCRNC